MDQATSANQVVLRHQARTPSRRRSGSLSRFTCSSPWSGNASGWKRVFTRFYRFSALRYFRHPAGPSTSRCAELAAAARPKLHGERRANGARRSSRCLSPRPQLRDFTKAIVLPNPQALPNPPAAGSGPKGKAVCKRSVRRDGRALSAMGTGICSQLPAGQSGLGGRPKTKPPAGDARGSCHSADCCGASPVASALGMEHRRDPALHNHYPTTASRAPRPKPDISTWQRIGHFYLALTPSSHPLRTQNTL